MQQNASENMTANFERKEVNREDFERLDEFVRQFDGLEIEVRPDPDSPKQADLAQSLSFYIGTYRHLRRAEPKSAKLMESAYALNLLITDVKAQGMVHPGSELRRKLERCEQELKACREDNRNLSLQLLEYKNRVVHE